MPEKPGQLPHNINISDTVAKSIEIHTHQGHNEYCPICNNKLGADSALCVICNQAVHSGCYHSFSRLCDNCHQLHLRTRENRRVVVVVGNQVATRKVFLWNQRHLVFGRARTEEDQELELTLRFLPLKPESKHRENADRTKRIPRRCGYLYLEDQTIMVGNLHKSMELRVGGKRLAPGEKQRILDDKFRLDIIEGLGLSGTCLRTDEGGIGGLILKRVGNEVDHEYWLVTAPVDLSIHLGLPGWQLVPHEGGFRLVQEGGDIRSLQPNSKIPLGGPEVTVLAWDDREFSIL